MLDALIGPSASRLFTQDHVAKEGGTVKRLVLRCAWCLEVVTDKDSDPPIDNVSDARSLQRHDARCRVADVLKRHSAGESVSADFEDIARLIESADFEKPH